MKRILIVCGCLCWAFGLGAEQLPDNIYFKAMRDEMQRTQKQLHLPGVARPFYTAYRISITEKQIFEAELGSLVSAVDEKQKIDTPIPIVRAYMYVGNAQYNSSGFQEDKNNAVVSGHADNNYNSIRDLLWQLTDQQYVTEINRLEQKTAVKQQKKLPPQEAEFSNAPHVHLIEPVTAFEYRNRPTYNALVQELSAKGQAYAYVEDYRVGVRFGQRQIYFLDSLGNAYQVQEPQNAVRFEMKLRTKDGLVETVEDEAILPLALEEEESFIRARSEYFLRMTQHIYEAKKSDFYIGPALLVQDGVSQFLTRLLVQNLRNTKPLLTRSDFEDKTVGALTKRVGMHITGKGVNVFDRPTERMWNGFALPAFRPVDAEGVAAQDLQIVENGKLKEIPTTRSLIKGQRRSNGHAVWSRMHPRAGLSNVFVTAVAPRTQAQLEQDLMQQCREQELDYCYVIYSWQGQTGLNLAERIYTADGRREFVYGFEPEQKNDLRSLRDIIAAGDQPELLSTLGDTTAIIAPPLLLREVELKPIERDPDRSPLVPMP